MLSRKLLALAILVSIAATLSAAPQQIPLDPAHPDAEPLTVQVVESRNDGLKLTLEIGALQHEKLTVDGRTWTALTLTDGTVEGEEGRPGLPVWNGLVVLPAGAHAIAQAQTQGVRHLSDIDLLPAQPDQSDHLVLDRAWYDKGSATNPTLVSLGTPASLAGVTVAPITIRPVSYDAATRTVTIATRIDIELNWTANNATPPQRPVPASMLRVLKNAAINLDLPPTNGAPGTWLILCPDNQSAINAIQPLADWRRRQGFNVVVADLGDTGPTTTNIKQWLRNQYQTLDPPLEYVVLVGDANGTVALPTWTEYLSGYSGEGDFYYTQLDGDDILSDVHIGRLSCRSISELEGIVSKIVNYETAPPLADPSWLTSALVVGDPSDSGITTVYCGEWLTAQLAPLGYHPITEVYSGNYASQMYSALNAGQSVFGYRGFAGMSGFSVGHASSLTNGGKLPFACIPTCLTGSFRSDTVCRSEAFLSNPNGGAIGAIGTATGGTHTRYNNCFFQGTWEGLVNSTDHHQGVAVTRGKLELYLNYWEREPNTVEIWSMWNNLMGDPASDIWMSVPAALTVDHPAALPAAATALPVTVMANDQPRAGVRVAAVMGEVVVSVGVTDASGAVTLPLAGITDGTLQVTVTGHDLLPYQGQATVGDQPAWVALDHWTLDDTAGNNDGLPNPGETLEIDLVLRNLGTATTTGVSATVTSESPYLTVTQDEASFGAMTAGAVATGDRTIRLAVSNQAPDAADCRLRIQVDSGAGSWVSQLDLAIVGSDFEPQNVDFSGGDPQPGSTGDLVITLANIGAGDCPGATAILRSQSPWVAITDSLGAWGPLASGGNGSNAGDPFTVAFATDCIRGHLAPFTVLLTQADGAERRVDFTVAVGTTSVTDPAGPDLYGYYAFDSGDAGYSQAPVYDWVEIDPAHGGSGTDVGLSDFGYEQDDTATVNLPFTCRYYGQEHDRLSICSNGWVAFGYTTLRHYRNWTVPSAGSPDAMIAVFWDDLKQSGSNRVYRWHDTANHRFIVQWSRMSNYTGGLQTCQVIILDPAHHPTTSGDSAIICQYHTVNNNDSSRGYATAGIQNHDRTDGVLYTYYADYAPGAAPLAAGLAIAYLPTGVLSLATCDVDPVALDFHVPVNGQANQTLHIANNGAPGADLRFAISQLDPTVSDPGAKSLTGSTVTLAETTYEPGVETMLHLSAYNGSNDDEWIVEVRLELPAGVNLIGASDMASPNGALAWQGGTGDGVDAVWAGSSWNVIHMGDTGEATLTIEVDSNLGDLELPWALQGDNYGGPPHSLTGSVSLISLSETVRVESPNGGEVWSEGETGAISWYSSPDVAAVDLELTRDGTNWETLATSLPAATGSYDWTVTGPVSSNCRVRASSTADPEVTDTSNGAFIIQHDLGWLSLDAWTGTVAAGQAVSLDVNVDAAGLVEGDHEQLLVISNNAGAAVSVPVVLHVGDTTPVNDLPRQVTLTQNHPNPFNPTTAIEFALPSSGPVDLSVYDLAGRRVALLVSGDQPAGRHTVVWQARDDSGRTLPSGTYVYRLRTDAGVVARKLSLLK